MYIKWPLALLCPVLLGEVTLPVTCKAQPPALRDAHQHLAPQTAQLSLPRVQESRTLLATWATASKVTHVLGRFINSPTHTSVQIT